MEKLSLNDMPWIEENVIGKPEHILKFHRTLPNFNGKKKKIETILDVDKVEKPISIQTYIDIFDTIFNATNSKELFKKLIKKNENPNFVSIILQYCILIRPLQINLILETLTLFTLKFGIQYTVNRFTKNLLIYKGVIADKLPKESYGKMLSLFANEVLANAIKNDDVKWFESLVKHPNFDPKNSFLVDKSSPLSLDFYGENDGDYAKITFMQFIAFCGAVKCFKYALKDGRFNMLNIANYAVAGGNREIIDILVSNGISFNNCFVVSVMFHRYELTDWLLKNYMCEKVKLEVAAKANNFRVFYFILKNEIDSSYRSLGFAFIEAVKVFNYPIAKYLIDEYNVNVEERNFIGETILHFAAKHNNLDVVKYLIEEKNVDVEQLDNHERTALYIASSCGHFNVIKYLVDECYADIDKISEDSLFIASMYGDIELVKYLVRECDADIWKENKYNEIPLDIAIENGQLQLVRCFIEEMDPYERCKNSAISGYYPLITACKKNQLSIVKYLVGEAGLDPNVRNNKGKTPLHYACKNKYNEIVRYLIGECHVDIRTNGNSVMKISCMMKDIKLVKYLVDDYHVNVNDKDERGITALRIACENGDFELIQYLVEKCHANVEEKDIYLTTALHIACCGKHLSIVRYLVEVCHANVNVKNNKGMTPLHFALIKENVHIAKYLIENCHSDVNVKNFNNETALHIACVSCCVDIVKLLVEKCHTNIEEKTKNGETPLFYAFYGGKVDNFNYLVTKCHARTDVCNNSGKTIVDIVFDIKDIPTKRKISIMKSEKDEESSTNITEHRYNDILYVNSFFVNNVDLLYEQDVMNKRDFVMKCVYQNIKVLIMECAEKENIIKKYGFVALYVACLCDDFDVVKYLIEVWHVYEQEGNKSKPLYYATCTNDLRLLKYLVEDCHMEVKNADKNKNCVGKFLEKQGNKYTLYSSGFNHSNNDDVFGVDKTLLTTSCIEGNLPLVKFAVEKLHQNPDLPDSLARVPIFYASLNGNWDIVKYLINDCHISPQKMVKTAVNIACEKGDIEIVKYLVEQCNMSAKEEDRYGRTPLIISKCKGKEDIVEYLSNL